MFSRPGRNRASPPVRSGSKLVASLAEGSKRDQATLVFMVLMAAVIAVSMKIVGVLLITALLIIPAAAARRFATSPEQMAVVAIILGIVSVYIGLNGSLEFDTPAGPSIVVAALACFVLSVLPLNILRNRTGRSQKTLKDPDTGVS